MALNFFSKGLPNSNDQPPPLGKTSNHPLTICPPRPTSPNQRPVDGTRVPSAIRRVFSDGVRVLSAFRSCGNILLQIEFTIAPSSKSPLTFDVIPFSEVSSPVAYRSTR